MDALSQRIKSPTQTRSEKLNCANTLAHERTRLHEAAVYTLHDEEEKIPARVGVLADGDGDGVRSVRVQTGHARYAVRQPVLVLVDHGCRSPDRRHGAATA